MGSATGTIGTNIYRSVTLCKLFNIKSIVINNIKGFSLVFFKKNMQYLINLNQMQTLKTLFLLD